MANARAILGGRGWRFVEDFADCRGERAGLRTEADGEDVFIAKDAGDGLDGVGECRAALREVLPVTSSAARCPPRSSAAQASMSGTKGIFSSVATAIRRNSD